ncbi:hypothetical protein JCM16358_09370 [Halanaerocella petrolearia]
MKLEAGFTLIEIVLVISLISIIAGIGLPSADNYLKKMRLATVINQLVSDLQLARQYSITKQDKYGIVFKPELNQYLLVKSKVDLHVIRRRVLQKVSIKEVTFPGNEVFFKSLGNLDGSNGRVVLQLEDYATRELIFSSNAGELTVK